MKLTDKVLVESFLAYTKAHSEDCKFLLVGQTSDHFGTLEGLVSGTKEDCLESLSHGDINELWTHVITDSVNWLKWKDTRESPSDIKGEYDDWLNQTIGRSAFGIEDLDQYFSEFIEFEHVLYGAERYYRDHFLHVLRVWLIGMTVFQRSDCIPVSGLYFDESRVLPIGESERLAIWAITALCHDLGYPIEKIGGINAPLRKMLATVGKVQVRDFAYDFPSQQQFINDFIVQFVSSKLVHLPTYDPARPRPTRYFGAVGHIKPKYKSDIQPKYYLKFSKSFEELKHGILSSTLLMRRLVYFLESDFDISELKRLSREDARQFLIRREILRAIATHTCEDIYHIRCDTISFLLIACDDLQEWNRPTLSDMRGHFERPLEVQLISYQADHVDLQMTISAVEGETFDGFLDTMGPEIKRVFSRLHKILRSAVDVRLRRFSYQYSMVLKHDTEMAEVVFQHSKDNTSRLLINGKEEPKWLYQGNKKLSKMI